MMPRAARPDRASSWAGLVSEARLARAEARIADVERMPTRALQARQQTLTKAGDRMRAGPAFRSVPGQAPCYLIPLT